jgi:hypothetical protein
MYGVYDPKRKGFCRGFFAVRLMPFSYIKAVLSSSHEVKDLVRLYYFICFMLYLLTMVITIWFVLWLGDRR